MAKTIQLQYNCLVMIVSMGDIHLGTGSSHELVNF